MFGNREKRLGTRVDGSTSEVGGCGLHIGLDPPAADLISKTMDAQQITTIILGAYSAALTTVVVVHQIRRSRAKLSVTCGFGYVKRREDAPNDPEDVPVITIQGVNVRTRPIEVRYAGFIATDGDEVPATPYLVEPSPTPRRLEDGDSVRFHFRADADLPPKMTAEVAKTFIASTDDRRWFGEPAEWLRPLRISKYWWRLPARAPAEA